MGEWEQTSHGPRLTTAPSWATVDLESMESVGWSELVVARIERRRGRRTTASRSSTGAGATCVRDPELDAALAARVRSVSEKLRVMVVDDHPMWREGVARDLTEAGIDVVATAANGTEAITRFPAAQARRARPRPADPRAQRGRGDRGGGQAGPVRPGADPVGERRAAGRAGGGQGGGDRLPRQVGLAGRAARRRTTRGPGRHRVHARPGRTRAGGVPPALRHRPGRRQGRHATADRARDRGPAAGGQGDVLQADRRAAVPLPPDGPEPRAEHACGSCSCTTGSSWSATRSSRGSTTRSDAYSWDRAREEPRVG